MHSGSFQDSSEQFACRCDGETLRQARARSQAQEAESSGAKRRNASKARIEHCFTHLYNFPVPELSRFLGIIIRMYAEAGAPHHGAHFHAYYQDNVGIFRIDPVEMIAGGLPARQRRFVEAWAELHQQELLLDWDRLQGGEKPLPIEPLR